MPNSLLHCNLQVTIRDESDGISVGSILAFPLKEAAGLDIVVTSTGTVDECWKRFKSTHNSKVIELDMTVSAEDLANEDNIDVDT